MMKKRPHIPLLSCFHAVFFVGTLNSSSTMPKANSTNAAKLRAVSHEFETDGIIPNPNSTDLLCRYCGSVIPMKRSQIVQHIGTLKHAKAKETKSKFQLMEQCNSSQQFSASLCRVIIIIK